MPKKNGKFKVCVDFKKFNATITKDLYPLPFIDEIINTIVRHEVYTFMEGFYGYHQISLALKD
jgi:putative transposase